MEIDMKKRIEIAQIIETDGPMNSVAKEDAYSYLGLDETDEEISISDHKALRAKKKKIVTSSKKLDRKISRETLRKVNRIDEED